MFETFFNISTNKQDVQIIKSRGIPGTFVWCRFFVPRDSRSKRNEKRGINAIELEEIVDNSPWFHRGYCKFDVQFNRVIVPGCSFTLISIAIPGLVPWHLKIARLEQLSFSLLTVQLREIFHFSLKFPEIKDFGAFVARNKFFP